MITAIWSLSHASLGKVVSPSLLCNSANNGHRSGDMSDAVAMAAMSAQQPSAYWLARRHCWEIYTVHCRSFSFRIRRHTAVYDRKLASSLLLPSTKEEVNAFARVWLSVCLLASLLKNAWMDLDEILNVDRYRDMNELITFEPDLDHRPDLGTRFTPDCWILAGYLKKL